MNTKKPICQSEKGHNKVKGNFERSLRKVIKKSTVVTESIQETLQVFVHMVNAQKLYYIK